MDRITAEMDRIHKTNKEVLKSTCSSSKHVTNLNEPEMKRKFILNKEPCYSIKNAGNKSLKRTDPFDWIWT